MATASATLNTPLSTSNNALTTSDSPTTGTSMVTSGTPLRSNDVARSVANTALSDPMGMVRDLVRQPSVKKALPIIVILMVVAAFGLASMSMKTPSYRALTMMLPEADKQLAIETLKNGNFNPQVDNNTGQIMVPGDKYQEARMLLASKGLPRTEAQGMDTLKDMPAMTTSQFMEQVRYNNAMEQELAKTISQIAGIRSARVHLAAPKQSVFVRDRVPTKASVIITRAPGKQVSSANVQAIISLVASSVPYLAPENVSVVDNYGTLMNEMLGEAPLGLTGAQLQQKQQMEDLYRTRLIQLLAPIVGEANVSAQVSLQLDFTQEEITTEDFDQRDKGPKTRSELFVEDRNSFKDAIGVPGSLSNTPPNPPQNPASSETSVSDPNKGVSEKGVQVVARSTKNYELDRAVRHTKSAMGNIQKLGVGVLINERPIPPGTKVEKPADGSPAPTTIPYTQEELDRLNQLVRGAVGFNDKRGDVVTVVATRFEPPIDPDAVPWYKDETLASLANSGVIAVLFLTFLLFVVRPMIKKLNKPEVDPAALAAAALAAASAEAASAEKMRTERIAAAEAEAAVRATQERLAREEAEEKARKAKEEELMQLQMAEEASAAEAVRMAEEEAAREAERLAAASEEPEGPTDVELAEGETLEDLKARMGNLKPKKQAIPADLLNNANSYDDKVALIRMIVSDNSGRVAGVMRGMIEVQ
ncbi:MAG: flagellar M-ring protein FliF [Betaproteobacteria bacterium]|nr:flagellar M-ring protein FliF [Betaproteobacteria bacterium]